MRNPIDDCVIVVDTAEIGGSGWMMDEDKSHNHKENLFHAAAGQRRLVDDSGAQHPVANTGWFGPFGWRAPGAKPG
jgi:hypothetical protein